MPDKKHTPTEQDFLNAGLGIVPAIDTVQDNPFPVGTIKFKDGEQLVYKHEYVDHYMNTIVMSRTLNLSPEDKDRYFQMITDYADILIKIVGDDNHVIWKAALGHPFEDLKRHAEKSGAVIDYNKPRQLLHEYDQWRKKKGLPMVTGA